MTKYLITCVKESDKVTLLSELSCVVNKMSYSNHTFVVDTDDIKSIQNSYDVGVETVQSNSFNEDDLDAVRSVSSKRILDTGHHINSDGADTQNWGLLRHTNESNLYASAVGSTDTQASLSANYTYNYTGDGVDMVFLENAYPVGLENHAEFKTGGTTRIQLLNWSAYISDLHLNSASTDYTSFGTSASTLHAAKVIATACSNTCGWATGAHIYVLRRDKTTLVSTPFDAVRLWHADKNNTNSANYTGRPTVVISAFTGVRAFPRLSSFSKINFRGNDYTTHYGESLYSRIQEPGLGLAPLTPFGIPGQIGVGRGETTALGTAVASMESAGVIHVTSAGNEGATLDVAGGVDYNNKAYNYTTNSASSASGISNTAGYAEAGDIFTHRGSSIISDDTIVVGSLASSFGVSGNTYNVTGGKEFIARSSARGARVDCYAAGENLNVIDERTLTYNGSNFSSNDGQVSGTSFSAPQVGGMAALVLEKYSGTTPAQMRMFFRHIAKSQSERNINYTTSPSTSADLYDNTSIPTIPATTDDTGDVAFFGATSGKLLRNSVGRIVYFDPTIPKDPRSYSSSDFLATNYTGDTTVEPASYLTQVRSTSSSSSSSSSTSSTSYDGNSMTTTQKLKSINAMLGHIGEAPVNSISNSAALPISVSTAINILDEISTEVQSEGWHFNTETGVKYTPTDGAITISADIIQFDPIDTSLDIVQRGTTLFDRKNNTTTFTSDLMANQMRLLDWDSLPEVARRYITLKASRVFQGRIIGSRELEALIARDESVARANLLEADGNTSDRTIFNSYATSARVGINRNYDIS